MQHKVGIMFGTHTLDAMNIYEDANGLFIIKTKNGMCGIEYTNIYFKYNAIVEINGHTYNCKLNTYHVL